MKRFIVTAGYMAECCTKVHTIGFDIRAPTEAKAITSFKRRVARKQYEIGDIIAFEV